MELSSKCPQVFFRCGGHQVTQRDLVTYIPCSSASVPCWGCCTCTRCNHVLRQPWGLWEKPQWIPDSCRLEGIQVTLGTTMPGNGVLSVLSLHVIFCSAIVLNVKWCGSFDILHSIHWELEAYGWYKHMSSLYGKAGLWTCELSSNEVAPKEDSWSTFHGPFLWRGVFVLLDLLGGGRCQESLHHSSKHHMVWKLLAIIWFEAYHTTHRPPSSEWLSKCMLQLLLNLYTICFETSCLSKVGCPKKGRLPSRCLKTC